MNPMTAKIALAAVLLSSAGLFSGCVVRETTYVEEHPERRRIIVQEPPRAQPVVVVRESRTLPPPPVVVYQEPPPPTRVVIVQQVPRDQVVVVRQRPPADIVERIPPQPSRNHVWTAGYWHAQHDQWVWVSGAWVLPPRPNAVYVKPHWEPSGTEFHFSVGVWK